MSKIVLNVRGAHCSGKTTSVRGFINSHPNHIETAILGGKKTDYTVIEDLNVIVLGRYDQGMCGGVDRYKNGNHVKEAIVYIAQTHNPDWIIYEGIMYSVTFKMADEIADICSRIGYVWESIFLYRDFAEMIDFLEDRNNGKPVNLEAVTLKWERVQAVYQKIISAGRSVKKITVTGMPKKLLENIINEEINGRAAERVC